MKLVVATRSRDKMREIRTILGSVPDLDVLDLDEAGVPVDPEEDHLEPYETFEENARSKALWFHERCGLPTVADDSGIEVDHLHGDPGVRSKRFAPAEGLDGLPRDEANNAHLLRLLEGVPPENRTARYVCVAVLVENGRESLACRGEAPGVILDAPRGVGGFGYDPLFFDPELGRTFAEIDRDAKNARSHRGRAFRVLAERLMERP
jgi:XTP/dITP diphosphohydrolase